MGRPPQKPSLDRECVNSCIADDAPTCTCAVCRTDYPRPAAGGIQRCPQCGSRLVRAAGEGGLTALSTAPPPVKSAPRSASPIATESASGLLITIGTLLCLVGVFLLASVAMGTMFRASFLFGTELVKLAGGIVGIAAGGTLIVLGVVRGRAALNASLPTATDTNRCRHCRYPLPLPHIGRCPECGRLQDPLDPRHYRCPTCRRDLHGFTGDTCPECGADIRDVTDGPPMA